MDSDSDSDWERNSEDYKMDILTNDDECQNIIGQRICGEKCKSKSRYCSKCLKKINRDKEVTKRKGKRFVKVQWD